MHDTVKAEGFIWLIVGVFWVIAQIAGAAAKKNQPKSPHVNTGDELLSKWAEIGEFRIERPISVEDPEKQSFTPIPERQSGSRTKNPWKPGDIEALPDMIPLRRMAAEPPAPAPVLPQLDARPKMSAFRNSIPSIKLPTMNMSFQGSATSVQKAPNLGKILNPSDKNSLRRAMISHIIFSPPKALEQPAKQ
jgi:hypothetical protein